MKTKFGAWLKAKLNDAEITQTELAERIGLQPPQVSRIISGGRGTTIEVLEGIATVLQIPEEEVFRAAAGKTEKVQKTKLVDQITHLSSELPEDEQQGLLAYIKLRHEMIDKRRKK